MARDGVTSSANRDEQVTIPGEANGLDDVVCTCTASDESWTSIDRAVPNPSGLLVSLLAGPKERPPKSGAK
jgi:hypothetical protein